MKDNIKLLLYQLVYRLSAVRPISAKSKVLLLVKTDEIGDYMLFRHQLAILRRSSRFGDHRIVLVANKICKPLFEQFDSATVDELIWVEKKRFRVSMRYRYRLLRRVRRTGASVAINAVYTRSFRYDDLFVAVSGAPERLAMDSFNALTTPLERRLAPRNLYSQLIQAGGETAFDALRNTVFMEKILRVPGEASVGVPAIPPVPVAIGLPVAFFVLFPGSGLPEKKWPAAHFAKVAHHLADRYQLTPVICGSQADIADSEGFLKAYGGPVLDLTGCTSLPEFLAVLSKAACLVSVDTGSVHLAAAVGCPVFALFSGIHYGRFAPYPRALAQNFHAVYPERIDAALKAGATPDFQLIPVNLIQTIPPEKFIAAIDAFLPDIRTRQLPAGTFKTDH